MNGISNSGRHLLAALAVMLAAHTPAYAKETAVAPESRYATVNGVKFHYLFAGKGPPVVLLHGYAQTSHMWRPLIAELAASHTVIAPDLRGAGGSDKPQSGYDKKDLAADIRELLRSKKIDRASVVGHDIGLMVAYAFAAQYPQATERVVLMDAFLPGIGNWKDVWLLRDLWHFHFHGTTPLALVAGRERTYFEHFWNDFAADPQHSVSEADRQVYAKAYAQPGGMRAGFEYFKSFEQDAQDFAELSQTKLNMPMLVLTGEKASGNFLIEQARLVAANVQGVVIKDSGHWLIDEARDQVIPQLVAFISEPIPGAAAASSASLKRMTPGEAVALSPTGVTAGTSGVAGIETRVLRGDPTRTGPYTIMLSVPANTTIQAHDHPDDRMATVVSGTWYFGYGPRFDEAKLKALPPGSFYTEPPNEPHFARTGNAPVVLHISGIGPTGTRYAQ